jgi:hypothetical protein
MSVKSLCLVIFTIQIVIAHFVLPTLGKADAYPFFDWNLFSHAPSETEIYVIKVTSIDMSFLFVECRILAQSRR